MSSTSETGHAVNLINFQTLVSRCAGYGPRYNTNNSRIQVANMSALSSNVINAIQNITTTKPAWDNAINIRQTIFADMVKLSTRVINAFEATENVTEKQVEDARTVIRKIRGERKSKKVVTPSPDSAEQISASQQSYANQILHFTELIGIVSADPTYTPNETELQVAQLQAFQQSMGNSFDTVNTTQNPYLAALATRNDLMYTSTTGLVDVALEAKKYVRSVSAITKEEFKQISGIKFRRLVVIQ